MKLSNLEVRHELSIAGGSVRCKFYDTHQLGLIASIINAHDVFYWYDNNFWSDITDLPDTGYIHTLVKYKNNTVVVECFNI